MARKIQHSCFFAKSQEQADAHVKRCEIEEGMLSMCAPYPATDEFIKEQHIPVNEKDEYQPYEHKWRMATKKEKRVIMEKKREEGIKNGIAYPFNII